MENTKTHPKNKLFPALCLLSAGLYFLAVWFLYYVKYRLFGGAVETAFLFVLIFPPVYLLLWLLQDKKLPKKGKQPENKKRHLLKELPLILCGIFCLWLLYREPRQLISYLFFALLLVLWLWSQARKRWPHLGEPGFGPLLLSLVFAVLTAVTALFVLACGLCTLPEAEALLRGEAGYSDVAFAGVYSSEQIGLWERQNPEEILASLKDSKQSQGSPCYLFRVFREGNPYGAFIQLESGRLLAELPAEEGMMKTILDYNLGSGTT